MAVVASVGLAWALLGIEAASSGRHPQDKSCADCHLAGEQVTEANAHLLTRNQRELCAECHDNVLAISHPTEIRPSMPIPVEYKLDWKGDVTCSTCHDLHGSAPGLLRGGTRGRALCLACHGQAFFERMADEGLAIQHSGHMVSAELPLSIELDSYSMACLGCHEDKAGGINNEGIMRHGDTTVDHPIGSNYEQAVVRRKGRVRSSATLPDYILLPDGRIGCVSCHVAYKEQHGGLLVTREGSRLCLTCHDI